MSSGVASPLHPGCASGAFLEPPGCVRRELTSTRVAHPLFRVTVRPDFGLGTAAVGGASGLAALLAAWRPLPDLPERHMLYRSCRRQRACLPFDPIDRPALGTPGVVSGEHRRVCDRWARGE